MKQYPLFFYLLPLLLILPVSGCREAKFESAWSEQVMTIDGRYAEWTAPMQYFDQPSMYMGFRNDRDDLYILIKAVDRRAQLKVLRLGLTVWFDPPHGKGKAWGVHYPVGLANPGISLTGRDVPGDFTVEQRERTDKMLGELEIREEGAPVGIRLRNEAADSAGYGIRVALRDTSEMIVYELKVPLHGNGKPPFTVVPGADGRVNLRIETGDIRPQKWMSIREDSLRVVDPLGNARSGKIRDRGLPEDRRGPRLSAPPNPLTEPIRFRASVALALAPGDPGDSGEKK